MASEVYNNPWASALPPSRNSFWESEVAQLEPAEQLSYRLGQETFSISGDIYEGFIRIWKSLLGGHPQLKGEHLSKCNISELRTNFQPDVDIVNVLRLSNMSDEALGNAWQEASEAVLFETDLKGPTSADVENAMEWRSFIVLLDRCCRISASDLGSFLGHFPLPLPPTAVTWSKRNPFQTNPFAKSATQLSSGNMSRNMHSNETNGRRHSQSHDSRHPASPLHSQEASQSWTSKAVPSSPSYDKDALENGSRRTQAARPRASSYLEDLQDLHLSSYPDGLEVVSATPVRSTMSRPETESVRTTSTLTNPTRTYEADTAPSPSTDVPQLGRFEFSRTKSEPPVPLNHPFFDEHAELEAPTTPRSPSSPSTTQKELPQIPKAARRTSLLGRMRSGSSSGPASPVDQRTGEFSMPGIPELESSQATSEARRIAQRHLMDMQGSDLPNKSKSSSFSLHRRSQSSDQFSLSMLAAGLEATAKEGSLPVVEAMFESGADPNFSVRGSRPTRHRALEIAAITGHPHIIDYMIRRGADSTAVNTSLIHSVLAGNTDMATHLILSHHADVDYGIVLQHANPTYGSYARTGYREHVEYLNVLSAASSLTDKEKRLRFLKVLLSKNCNVNASIWTVYKLKEIIKPSMLSQVELETGAHYGTPKIVHDGFGYSPLARFTPICLESVKLLLRGMHSRSNINLQVQPTSFPKKAIFAGISDFLLILLACQFLIH